MYRKIFLSEIVNLIDIKFTGKDCLIEGLNFCDRNSNYNSILSFVTSKKYRKVYAENNKVRALFITEELLPFYKELKNCSFFVVINPEKSFYELHDVLIKNTDFYDKNKNTKIESDIHESVIIEDNVQIGKNVRIGYNSVVKSNTIIKDNVKIGENVVVGAEGFQIVKINGLAQDIEHKGGVIIEEGVFIAAGTTISKSLFEGEVVIGKNTKIDSQVHIGHNCKIGENTVIAGNSLIMGSVDIGDNVWIAPSCAISNKVYLKNNSFVGSLSLVNRSTKENERIMGNPAIPMNDYIRLLIEQKKIVLSKKQK